MIYRLQSNGRSNYSFPFFSLCLCACVSTEPSCEYAFARCPIISCDSGSIVSPHFVKQYPCIFFSRIIMPSYTDLTQIPACV